MGHPHQQNEEVEYIPINEEQERLEQLIKAFLVERLQTVSDLDRPI